MIEVLMSVSHRINVSYKVALHLFIFALFCITCHRVKPACARYLILSPDETSTGSLGCLVGSSSNFFISYPSPT